MKMSKSQSKLLNDFSEYYFDEHGLEHIKVSSTQLKIEHYSYNKQHRNTCYRKNSI